MSIYQFTQFRFDESRGSLLTFKDDDKSADDNLLTSEQTVESPSDVPIETKEVQLRRKVANLLSYLIENQDRIISKEELLSELWVHGDYRENSLTQSIRELRSALGDNAKSPSYIKTYSQRGYQWIQTPTHIVQGESPTIASPYVEEEEDSAIDKSSDAQIDHTIRLENDIALEALNINDVLPVEGAPVPEVKPIDLNEKNMPQKGNKNKRRFASLLSILVLFTGLLFWFNENREYAQSNNQNIDPISKIKSILVLPFINATDKPSMGWLELGLADMLSVELQRHDSINSNLLHITPPAVANAMLLNAQLPWPTLPVHIRSLLREHNIDVAIFASVRLYKTQQVLDFQIIHAKGEIQQGTISYPSLPAELQSISQQILYLLNPDQTLMSVSKSENPITSLALAKGMQALQQDGPLHAIKYFQAVLLLEEENYWAKAYSARSAFALGQWHDAEEGFKSISTATLLNDPSLDAFIHYWLAQIAFRRGDNELDSAVDIAIDKAESASDAKQMARSYRLKAQIAWQQNDWSAHQMWSDKAQNLFTINNELSLEADKLFYLGSPSNTGLEKAPKNDLQENRSRLLKALNFYQQLGDQNMIAASQFAIAQNYTFDLPTRSSALQTTIDLYKKLQQSYELAQALNYAGFYHMQLHDGETANHYFSQARDIAKTLGARPLVEMSDFYIAFSLLDQGLDQSALGRHGKNEDMLNKAISHLENFIANNPTPELHGSALVFLGWANTELANFDLALAQLTKAKQLNSQLNMATTLGYSNYSIMRIHLERGDYRAVIAMADQEITTRLQATFLARAYYEENEVEQALTVLTKFKTEHPELWQPEDKVRLGQYQSSLLGTRLSFGEEPKAHLVYCESDWQL